MRVILLNGSPRFNWNTAKLVQSAQEGAKSAGAETEYVDLYKLNYVGCHACMLCKLKGAERCRCYWKDDLSPLLERIFSADALILGVPNYLSNVTSQVQALIERLVFCSLSYDDYANYFNGRVLTAFIIPMNSGKEWYEHTDRPVFEHILGKISSTLRSDLKVLPVFNTLQVDSYNKYSMSGFDAEAKEERYRKVFPADLEAARQLGEQLAAHLK